MASRTCHGRRPLGTTLSLFSLKQLSEDVSGLSVFHEDEDQKQVLWISVIGASDDAVVNGRRNLPLALLCIWLQYPPIEVLRICIPYVVYAIGVILTCQTKIELKLGDGDEIMRFYPIKRIISSPSPKPSTEKALLHSPAIVGHLRIFCKRLFFKLFLVPQCGSRGNAQVSNKESGITHEVRFQRISSRRSS